MEFTFTLAGLAPDRQGGIRQKPSIAHKKAPHRDRRLFNPQGASTGLNLLNGNFSASFLKFFLGGFGIILGHAFLNSLGSGFHHLLGFFQAQPG